MLAYDRSLRTYDADGRLHVELCNISKATVNPYYGREIPGYRDLGLHPDVIYQLYRDPAELAKAAPTFERVPLLVEHIYVNADKPEKESIGGVVGGPVRFEHPYLKAPVSAWTRDAIAGIETHEAEQLSSSYRYDADMTPGVSPEGLRYDGVMRNIRANHVALVPAGRAGPDVVVADSKPKGSRVKNLLRTALAMLANSPEERAQIREAVAMDAHGLTADEMKGAREKYATELGKACDAMTDEETEEAYKRAAKDKLPKPLASDEAQSPMTQDEINAAIAAARAEGKAEGAAEAQAAHDAALAAAQAATAAQIAADAALTAAKAEVAPVVGEAAFDSAEGVYAYALDQLRVDRTDVPAAAYPALFRVAAKVAAVEPPAAHDAAPAKTITAADVFPGVAKIQPGV